MCERLGEVSADGLLAGVPGASRSDARGRCPPGRILGQRRQRGPMLGTVPWAQLLVVSADVGSGQWVMVMLASRGPRPLSLSQRRCPLKMGGWDTGQWPQKMRPPAGRGGRRGWRGSWGLRPCLGDERSAWDATLGPSGWSRGVDADQADTVLGTPKMPQPAQVGPPARPGLRGGQEGPEVGRGPSDQEAVVWI